MPEVGDLRTHIIASQAAVTNLHEELLSCNNEQLASVHAAVKTTVHDTVHDTQSAQFIDFSNFHRSWKFL